MRKIIIGLILLLSVGASAQWQQTGSKVRYVNGLGIPTKDTASGVAADSSQILIRPADSSLYIKYKRTWVKVGAGGGGTIGGSGTINRVPKFTAGTTIGNSSIVDSASAVAVTINPSGNVGIGTTSPAYPFQVRRAGGSGSLGISIDNVVGTDRAVQYFAVQDNEVGAGSGHAFYYRAQGSTTDVLGYVLDENGRFGIGTVNPAATLAVQGTTLINTNTDNGVDKLQVNGSVTASGTLTAATIVKAGGTSLQFLMADGSTSLGGGGSLSGTTNYVAKFTASTAIGNSQIIDDGTNLSLRTTASTYPVNINTGANSGMAFYQDGTTATILGTNQNLTSTAPLGFVATQYIFSGASGGKITVNTASDNGVDKLQVLGSISGIGMKQGYVAKTGAYTATNDDYVIDCTSGTFTVSLPASSGRTGRILIIKNSGAGTITVDGDSTETIDGAATVTLSVQYATIQIMSDGANWKTIAKF
jgi:hypothetical protein